MVTRITNMNRMTILILCSIILISCSKKRFLEDKIIGGKLVTKETLNQGLKVYEAKCMSCHGENGDGTGITYRALKTPPRNLTQGIYKFGLSLDGGLPTDEDFAKILNEGLRGTAMIPWGLNSEDVYAVTQYIKTFAPEVWSKEKYVKPIRPTFTKDPYQLVYENDAVLKGKEIYHQKAACYTCHRSYLSVDEMRSITGDSSISETSDIFHVKVQPSEYYSGIQKDKTFEVTPPDFLKHNIRSARNVEEIYKRLIVGVNGTAMPSWKDTLTDDEIWAVSYYVNSLVKNKK